MRTQVGDVMTETVVTIHPDAGFREAVERMMFHDISGMPVVDDQGRLVGLITEGDLLEKEARTRGPVVRRGPMARLVRRLLLPDNSEARRRAEGRTVADVMTGALLTARPDEPLHKAARRMARGKIKRLPEVDGQGRLIGILSRHDVLEVFDRTDAELRRVVTDFLVSCCFVEPDASIAVEAHDGIVALTGHVRRADDVAVAGALALSVDGVVEVDNRLTALEAAPRRVS